MCVCIYIQVKVIYGVNNEGFCAKMLQSIHFKGNSLTFWKIRLFTFFKKFDEKIDAILKWELYRSHLTLTCIFEEHQTMLWEKKSYLIEPLRGFYVIILYESNNSKKENIFFTLWIFHFGPKFFSMPVLKTEYYSSSVSRFWSCLVSSHVSSAYVSRY